MEPAGDSFGSGGGIGHAHCLPERGPAVPFVLFAGDQDTPRLDTDEPGTKQFHDGLQGPILGHQHAYGAASTVAALVAARIKLKEALQRLGAPKRRGV